MRIPNDAADLRPPHQMPSSPWAPVGTQGDPHMGEAAGGPHPALQMAGATQKGCAPAKATSAPPRGPSASWVFQSGSRRGSRERVGDGFLAIPRREQAGEETELQTAICPGVGMHLQLPSGSAWRDWTPGGPEAFSG